MTSALLPQSHQPLLFSSPTLKTGSDWLRQLAECLRYPEISQALLISWRDEFLPLLKGLSSSPYHTAEPVLRNLWHIWGHHPDILQKNRPETRLKTEVHSGPCLSMWPIVWRQPPEAPFPAEADSSLAPLHPNPFSILHNVHFPRELPSCLFQELQQSLLVWPTYFFDVLGMFSNYH